MTERERAIKIAKSMIDKRCVDPDCEQCILARQFLRALDREAEKFRDDDARDSERLD